MNPLEILPHPEPAPSAPNPQNLQPSTCNLQPPPPVRAFGHKLRNGKIARLPYLERDMVNRMLRNNIHHSRIKNALDEHGYNVTERNISNWKTRGGYHDWRAEQDRAVENRLRQDNLTEHLRTNEATQLPEVGLQLAATELAEYFLKPETRQQLATDPDKFARTIWTLCRLTRQIFNLQRYRDQNAKALGEEHDPHRLKHEIEKQIEQTREIFSAADLGERPSDPIVPHRNYFPRGDRPAPPEEEEEDKLPEPEPLWKLILKENLKNRSKSASKPKAKKRKNKGSQTEPPTNATPSSSPGGETPSPSPHPMGKGPE